MIIVRVELHSAITGQVTELARMLIANKGVGGRLRDYAVATMRGRSAQQLDRMQPQRTGEVLGWPSEAVHVWNLVATALRAMGYDQARPRSTKRGLDGEGSGDEPTFNLDA